MRFPWDGPASLMDGTAAARQIKAELAARVKALNEREFTPA